jgi:hypothetical protein
MKGLKERGKLEDCIDIGLSLLIYWFDPPRIQTWPAMLATVAPDTIFASVTDCGRQLFSDRMTDDRHLGAHHYIRNLPGLEARSDRLVLRGVGILEKSKKGYRFSNYAKKLMISYQEKPKDKAWVQVLAQIMLEYDPRTRAFVRALSKPEAMLSLNNVSGIRGGWKTSKVMSVDEGVLFPFDEKEKNTPNLRDALADDPWWCLGKWRENSLLSKYGNCRFTGHTKPEVSLHDISLAMKCPFEVLLFLGVLQQKDNECWLDQDKAVNVLGEEMARDFGWAKQNIQQYSSVKQIVAKIVKELKSDTGFIVAAKLREKLRAMGVANPDKEIAALESSGDLVIENESAGQSRHGKGLYSDPHKQLIKIRIIGGA